MKSDYFAAQANRILSTFENASLSISVRQKIIRLNTTLIKLLLWRFIPFKRTSKYFLS